MRICRLPLIFSLLFCVAILIPAADSWGFREVKEFNLLTGKGLKDPYTLSFPFTVTAPGAVRVSVNFQGNDYKHVGALSLSSPGLRRPIESQPISSKKTNFQLRHNIDSLELDKLKGKYVVYLSNLSTKRRETGQIIISYPVAGEEQAGSTPTYPDLAIEEISLNKENLVVVKVTNMGPGRIPGRFYRDDSPELFLYVDGRSWGGASLPRFDPDQKLDRPRGAVRYVSNLKINGAQKVRAEIRPGKTFRDGDPNNNARNAVLESKIHSSRPMPMAKPMIAVATMPDLAIEKVFLNQQCQVSVLLANKGNSALPAAAYEKQTSPVLMLYRDGKSWGGAALWVIDPDKRLMKPGGGIVYTSNLKVGGETKIRAEVDKENVIRESEANNNGYNTVLKCSN